jgi:hypothetical protein
LPAGGQAIHHNGLSAAQLGARGEQFALGQQRVDNWFASSSVRQVGEIGVMHGHSAHKTRGDKTAGLFTWLHRVRPRSHSCCARLIGKSSLLIASQAETLLTPLRANFVSAVKYKRSIRLSETDPWRRTPSELGFPIRAQNR